VTYIRWGRTTCPDTNGTEVLYIGRAAGPPANSIGGGSNFICLADEPEFLELRPGFQGLTSNLVGTEYETRDGPVFSDLHNHNVPCVGCYTGHRAAKIMIPGKTSCPSTWTVEYYGYLMSELAVSDNSHFRMSYECVDAEAEAIANSEANIDGNNSAWLYLTEASCSGISCPPYPGSDDEGAEVTCVVCTK